MNQETIATLSPTHSLFAKFDAKTIENLTKIGNPLAGITITPEMARMCNPLAGITPETVRVLVGWNIPENFPGFLGRLELPENFPEAHSTGIGLIPADRQAQPGQRAR